MTDQSYVLIWGMVFFFALEFLVIAYFLFVLKHKDDEPKLPTPVDFKWPDQVRLEYTDAAGNVVADCVFRIERPN